MTPRIKGAGSYRRARCGGAAISAVRRVHVESLREDSPAKRSASEARIRAFVDEASRDGGRVIVIPFRVAGFGPYARVLEGLPYASDGRALLPSAEVEHWCAVRRRS